MARRREYSWALVIVLVGLVAAFTAMMIQYSRSYGRMLVGPLYDDVVYLDEGLRYAQLAQTEGGWALVREAVGRPPHSPLATSIALVSFLLCGPVEWAPYALMGLVVLAVVLAADRLLVDLPAHARVAGALFVLTFPIVGTLPYHFRPDATAGLATGFGVMMMLRYPPSWAPRAYQYWTGASFALALLVKPSAAPFTLWLFAGSWVLSMLAGGAADRFVSGASPIADRQNDRRGYWRAIWPYWVPVLALAGPYYWLAGGTVYRYIYENVFGQNRDVWRLQRDWPSLALFILTGEGGQTMLRAHLYLVIGLAGVAGALHGAARLGRGVDREVVKVALVLVGALFLTWLVPSLSRYGNPFTGSAFAAILLFVGVLLVRSLFGTAGLLARHERRRRGLGTALGWSAAVVAVLVFQWPVMLGTRNTDWVLNDNRVERAVYRAIADHAAGNVASVFVTSAANLNADLLRFRARAEHAPLAMAGPPFSTDTEIYRAAIEGSDYVVSGDPGAFRENRRMPFYAVQGRVVGELKADPGFTVLATVPTYQGLNLYVFARKPAFGGWSTVRGLGPPEGPFPAAENKTVRWGLGPVTHFTVTSPTARDGVVDFSAAVMIPGQAVEIVLNGASVRRMALAPRGFESVQVPVSWRVGENWLELRYATWEPPSSDSGRAVLFRRLRTD